MVNKKHYIMQYDIQQHQYILCTNTAGNRHELADCRVTRPRKQGPT